jgi:hypothetical protein
MDVVRIGDADEHSGELAIIWIGVRNDSHTTLICVKSVYARHLHVLLVCARNGVCKRDEEGGVFPFLPSEFHGFEYSTYELWQAVPVSINVSRNRLS